MKQCKHCKELIAKKAKICPNCGCKSGMPTIIKLLIVVGIIIACIGGCAASFDNAVKEVKDSYKDLNGKTKFKLNESFENSYEKITMTEYNTDFKDYNTYLKPSSGNKVVMLKFEIENTNADNDDLIVSSTEFKVYADGVIVDSFYGADDKYKDLDSFASISKGKKAVGYVFYEVPKNTKEITVEYNANFWVDDTTIEFIVK